MSLQNLFINNQKKYWERLNSYELTVSGLTIAGEPVLVLDGGTAVFDAGASINIASYNSGVATYKKKGEVWEIGFTFSVNVTAGVVSSLVVTFPDLGFGATPFPLPSSVKGTGYARDSSNNTAPIHAEAIQFTNKVVFVFTVAVNNPVILSGSISA